MPPSSSSAVRKAQNTSDPTRRQSGRQIRTSTSRPVNYYARPFTSSAGNADEPSEDGPPGFFPAIQYFTDAITALPKETMRHFTLMKEVEAKIHGPSQTMEQLASTVSHMPFPPRKDRQPSRQALLSFTANNSSAATSANGSVVNGHGPSLLQQQASDADDQTSTAMQYDPQMNFARRQEFHNLRMVIQSILANMDEKNVCLAEGNRTLARQLSRVESVMPHIESEISEEARLGSKSHWAYADNRTKNKAAPATVEKARRDVAATNSLAAAAATVHEGDIAAARSEARREAKRARNQAVDSELEDRPLNKKTQVAKVRKAVESAAGAKGLGIVNGMAVPQPQKRRKVEKEAGGALMERTLSGVTAPKASKGTGSTPRSTPAAEPVKKKSAKPTPALPPVKKRNNANSPHQSPRTTSFPTLGSSTSLGDQQNNSTSSRMRQGSSTLQHSKLAGDIDRRPSSSAGIKTSNGEKSRRASVAKTKEKLDMTQDAMDVDVMATKQHAHPEPASGVNGDSNVISEAQEKGAVMVRGGGRPATIMSPNVDQEAGAGTARPRSNGVRSSESVSRSQKSSVRDGEEPRSHSRNSSNQHILRQIASFNRSPVQGRREVTGEEGEGSGQERDEDGEGEGAPTGRRILYRRIGAEMDEAPQQENITEGSAVVPEVKATAEPTQANGAFDGSGGEIEEDEESNHDPDDPDEIKYCYCGRGSYGQMIACDNPNCEKEWFHLECTGLKTAPAENVKWFCNDCDPKMRKKLRPMSRH